MPAAGVRGTTGTEITRIGLLCGHGMHLDPLAGRCVFNHREEGYVEPRREEYRREEYRDERRHCPRGYHLGEEGGRCWPDR